jgi:hypothetical protein
MGQTQPRLAFADLPPMERVERYLQLADDSREKADRCNPRMRESYLIMARYWEDLAVTTVETMIADARQGGTANA